MIKIKHKRYKGLLHTKIYMVEADDNIFYKYMAINDNTLKVLKNQEFYFSQSSEFNDPFDSKSDLIWKGNMEDWIRLLKSGILRMDQILQLLLINGKGLKD